MHPEASRITFLASGGKRGLAQSLFQVGGNFGGSLGPLLVALLVAPYGRQHLLIFAFVALAAIAVMYPICKWYKSYLNRMKAQTVSIRKPVHLPLPMDKTAISIGILLILIFSKYIYMASLTSYYTFYLIHKFNVTVQESQLYLFIFLVATAIKSTGIRHRYLKSGDSKKKAVIVVSSNRGLAGGYNSNIIRLVTESGIPKEDALIFAIGRKGRDGLARNGYEIKEDYSDVIDEPLYSDAQQISKELLAMFEKNEIGEIYLAYTAFKNTVSQIPTFLKLLPVDLEKEGPKGEVKEEKSDLLIMNYEPDEDEVLDAIIPKYVSSLIYGAFLEAVASENGARMTAMDSATNNAEEMIGKLSLQYNRARQGYFTQELTAIIKVSNAIDG